MMRIPQILGVFTASFALHAGADVVFVGGSFNNGDQESGVYEIINVPSASQASTAQNHTSGGTTSLEIDLTQGNSFGQWKGVNTSGFGGPWPTAVTPGDEIKSTMWVYIPSATVFNGTAKVNMETRYGGGGTSIGTITQDLTSLSRNTWHEVTGSVIVPAGITELQLTSGWNVETLVTPTGYSGVLYLDDFEIVKVAPTLPPHGLTLNPTQQDLDGNGLSDLWEAIYGAKGIDPLADSDGDGVSNGDESKAGTNPFDPNDKLDIRIDEGSTSGQANVCWPILPERPGLLQTTTDPSNPANWGLQGGSPSQVNGEWQVTINTPDDLRFYRVMGTENDGDTDDVPDWLEPYLGFDTGSGNGASAMEPISYDTTGDNIPDTTLSGDLSAFNEIYRKSEPGTTLTRSQAARLLIQGTFGARDMNEIDYVAGIGAEAWIDEQIAQPITYHQPYIDQIKADWAAGNTDPSIQGYSYNGSIVFGNNYTTSWARASLDGPDQLRQRVAYALSQIVVTSRGAAMLANQPRTTAHYYDQLLTNAFGNYEDLLLNATLAPMMGHFLSHIGNRKKDLTIGRFPDENYAREIMQLFSIGLWELNMDGTQKLDVMGEPIPTYSNLDITELARVFTGTNYASKTNAGTNFGAGWRDDGDSNFGLSNANEWMLTPMKVYSSEHDWDTPRPYVVTGNGTTFTLPIRSQSNENARLDVEDVVHQLVHHPSCAPFISKQLIQFLVTSNPTPAYVERVATVFADNGSGVTGDLEAVIKAILLDDEARDPLEHLTTSYFGQLREPTLRTMHMAKILNINTTRLPNLMFWDWGNYKNDSLNEPMHAPTVFNFFRPDFSLFGTLAENGLDSPAFQIVNSYSSISFPNRMWNICNNGFTTGSGLQQQEDLSELEALASDIPALLDHLSVIYCAGTLSANSRDIITTTLSSTTNLTQRARLAAYLVINSPEGACLK